MLEPQILYSDNHLLVVIKPAGMPSQPDSSEAESVYDWAVSLIREEKGKVDGNVFCGIVHRLDRNVSGIMVLARTSKGASRLSASWGKGVVKKVYYALTEPPPPWKKRHLLQHHLERIEKTRRTTVHTRPGPRTKAARTRVSVISCEGRNALVRLEPETGRSHQLRAQMSFEGHPLLGDKKYGSERLDVGLSLHAYQLEFPHPTRSEILRVTCELPASWCAFVPLPDELGDVTPVEWIAAPEEK